MFYLRKSAFIRVQKRFVSQSALVTQTATHERLYMMSFATKSQNASATQNATPHTLDFGRRLQ
jgi:hypothetical protein